MKYLERLFKRELDINVGETVYLQYWPRHKEVPAGWRKVVTFGNKSSLWRAVLLRKIENLDPQDVLERFAVAGFCAVMFGLLFVMYLAG